MALDHLPAYKTEHTNHKFIFAAFNALNKAEEKIIQDLLTIILPQFIGIMMNFMRNQTISLRNFLKNINAHGHTISQMIFNGKRQIISMPKNNSFSWLAQKYKSD